MTKKLAETIAQDFVVCLYDEGIVIDQSQYQQLINIFYQNGAELIDQCLLQNFLNEYISSNYMGIKQK